ncbi:hypothetical protein ACJJI5_11080 [Microbulbifer sp. EKSA008]|uniref:hypothetical protein n=1 Tax=unclassified Microbulbifer TaxID=2619833 RepID=UPI0040390D0C
MDNYRTYEEVLEAYNSGEIPNGEACDRFLEHITSKNISEVIDLIPSQYIFQTMLRTAAYCPTTNEGWMQRKMRALNYSDYSKKPKPLDENHPFRVGIEALREYVSGGMEN